LNQQHKQLFPTTFRSPTPRAAQTIIIKNNIDNLRANQHPGATRETIFTTKWDKS
jgi:hypothetical protein